MRVCRDGSALLDRRGRVDANAERVCLRMQSYTGANYDSHASADLHVRASSSAQSHTTQVDLLSHTNAHTNALVRGREHFVFLDGHTVGNMILRSPILSFSPTSAPTTSSPTLAPSFAAPTGCSRTLE